MSNAVSPIETEQVRFLVGHLAYPSRNSEPGLVSLNDTGLDELAAVANCTRRQMERTLTLAVTSGLVRVHTVIRREDPCYPRLKLTKERPFLLAELTEGGWVEAHRLGAAGGGEGGKDN